MKAYPNKLRPTPKAKRDERVLSGSILEIASGFLDAEEARPRKGHEPKRRGAIAAPLFRDRKKIAQDFMTFLSTRRGTGAVSRLRLSDLAMEDVEAFNQAVVEKP